MTPIEQLITKLELKRNLWKADGNATERRIRGSYVDAIIEAKHFLEKETKALDDAYDKGFKDAQPIKN